MQDIAEFISNNLLLATGLLASGLAVIFYELRLQARNVGGVSIPAVVRMINDGSKIIDVRPAELFTAGHIVDARNIGKQELLDAADKTLAKHKKNVVLVCDNGAGSAECATKLRKDGYENVFSLRGGLDEWRKENLPLVGAGK